VFRFDGNNFRGRTEKPKVVLAVIKLIETDICLDGNSRSRIAQIGITTRNDGETFAFWFPREVRDSIYAPCQTRIAAKQARNYTFELDNFYREVLFAHAEYLEVAKHRFFSLGVAVNPDTEEVAPILPIQPTLKENANQLPWTNRKAHLYNPTSETLNRFFWQRTVRVGKLISVTRAG
jgi:hypothetical protein